MHSEDTIKAMCQMFTKKYNLDVKLDEFVSSDHFFSWFPLCSYRIELLPLVT